MRGAGDVTSQFIAITQKNNLSEAQARELISRLAEEFGIAVHFENKPESDHAENHHSHEKKAQPSLPETAPALWAERTSGREVTPVDFVKKHYGQWIDYASPIQSAMSRQVLRRFDLPLYNAYAAWIRRHPEDDLGLPTRSEVLDSKLAHLSSETLQQAGRLRTSAYRRRQKL